MCVQNDQHDEKIFSRYVCWGTQDPPSGAPSLPSRTPPPNPPRQSIRLTVSQSVSQAGRQAVNEAGRHAGSDTQLGFFGVSLHLQTKKRLTATTNDISREEKHSVPKWTGVDSIPRPTDWPPNVLSLSRFANQG